MKKKYRDIYIETHISQEYEGERESERINKQPKYKKSHFPGGYSDYRNPCEFVPIVIQ